MLIAGFRASGRQVRTRVPQSIPSSDHPQSYPGADADLAAPEEVEVTDPRHPLYRRRFRLLSVVQGQRSVGFVFVEYRLDICLTIPLSATSLQAVVTDKVPTKLSLEALGDLLTVAGGTRGDVGRARRCLAKPAGKLAPAGLGGSRRRLPGDNQWARNSSNRTISGGGR
jgi:hypothetical protein